MTVVAASVRTTAVAKEDVGADLDVLLQVLRGQLVAVDAEAAERRR